MRIRTLAQNHQLHKLLTESGLNYDKDKAALAKEFSNGRTERTSQLYTTECDALIRQLAAGLGQRVVAPTPEQEEESDKMRRKILSLAHEMHWHLPGTAKVDMARVNAWCDTYGFKKFHLNQYTHAELTKLVSQFKIVYRKYLDELQK